MKLYLLIGSIIGVMLTALLQTTDYLDIEALNNYKVSRVISLFVTAIFVWSVVGAFKKIFAPLIIMVTGITVILISAHVFEVELNYYAFEDDREQIIERLVAGKIKKEDSSYSGFAFYHTPYAYKKANRSDYIDASVFSEEKHFVFFQSAKPRLMDFVGLTEGFVYSSTGEFPTQKELDMYPEYKKINDHWYFVSSDRERLKSSCLVLCEKDISSP